MSLSKSDRIHILNQHLKALSDLSNREYQKRVWILGQGPECQGFDDFVCDYFDEADGIIEKFKDFELTEYQCSVLKTFRDRFEEFCNDNDYPEEFIDTSEWEEIICMARKVLKDFNYQTQAEIKELMIEKGLAEFARSSGIPDFFIVKLTNNPPGVKYSHPLDTGTYIRWVLPPLGDESYVIHKLGGLSVDRFGDMVPNKSVQSRIPTKDFIYKSLKEVDVEQMEMIRRKQTVVSFLENLSCIADKEYQKRAWIGREGPEVDDFERTVCDYFDLGDFVFGTYCFYDMTQHQKTALNRFRGVFDKFSTKNNAPEKFIDTPEWEKIMNMAKDVLKAFNYQKPQS